MLTIIAYPNPLLSQVCEAVTEFGPELHKQLDDMLPVMKAHKGIGLAANQVGIAKRFFIMLDSHGAVHEFINPEIIEQDGSCQVNEGCLSASGVSVQVPRYQSITVKAFNRHGEEFKVVCYDIESICIQHELNHLDGIFFLDLTSRQQRRQALKQLGLK